MLYILKKEKYRINIKNAHSLFPRTTEIWNQFHCECFQTFYNLELFKSKVNKLTREGADDVTLSVVGSGVSNPNEAVCISHNTDSFRKGMNPTILPPAMGK